MFLTLHCIVWGGEEIPTPVFLLHLSSITWYPSRYCPKRVNFYFVYLPCLYNDAGLSLYKSFLLLADLYVKYLKLNYNMVQFGMMKLLIICIFLTQIWILEFCDLEEFPFNYIITGLQVEHMVLHIDQLYLSHHDLCETNI